MIDKLIAFLKKYVANKLAYVKIEISIEAGNIVNLKVTESIKL